MPGDRALFSAPGIAPDGSRVYAAYNAFTTPTTRIYTDPTDPLTRDSTDPPTRDAVGRMGRALWLEDQPH